MLPLGEDIYNYEVEQPLLFINTQAFHCWSENHEPQKAFINKKPGAFSRFLVSHINLNQINHTCKNVLILAILIIIVAVLPDDFNKIIAVRNSVMSRSHTSEPNSNKFSLFSRADTRPIIAMR